MRFVCCVRAWVIGFHTDRMWCRDDSCDGCGIHHWVRKDVLMRLCDLVECYSTECHLHWLSLLHSHCVCVCMAIRWLYGPFRHQLFLLVVRHQWVHDDLHVVPLQRPEHLCLELPGCGHDWVIPDCQEVRGQTMDEYNLLNSVLTWLWIYI